MQAIHDADDQRFAKCGEHGARTIINQLALMGRAAYCQDDSAINQDSQPLCLAYKNHPIISRLVAHGALRGA
jgi:hypothetical protein